MITVKHGIFKFVVIVAVLAMSLPTMAESSKDVNDLMRKAENLSFSGKIQEADELLKQAEKAAEEIMQGNNEEEKAKIKRLESKLKYVRKQLDRKLESAARKKTPEVKPVPENSAEATDSMASGIVDGREVGNLIYQAEKLYNNGKIQEADAALKKAKQGLDEIMQGSDEAEKTKANRYESKYDYIRKKIDAQLAAAETEKSSEKTGPSQASVDAFNKDVEQLIAVHEKYKDRISVMNENPRVFMPASLEQAEKALEYYNFDLSEFESALKTFTEKYGSDQETLNSVFRENGVTDVHGIGMYIPQWIKNLKAHEVSREKSAEMIVKSAQTMLDVESVPDVMRKRLKENKEILKIGQKIYPHNPELNTLLAEMDDRIAAFEKRNKEKIDTAVFKDHIGNFAGPGNVKSLAKAALDFFKNDPGWGKNTEKKMEMLTVTIQGQWQPAERNVLGYILSYRLPILLAYTTPEYEKDNLAKVIELSVITPKASPGQAEMAPPFENYWVGDSYMMRLDKIR